MDRALIVFAKAPEPGRVKTRLTPVLAPAEAAQLYEAFLRDAMVQYDGLDVDVHLYFAPPLPSEDLTAELRYDRIRQQRGEGLGERMRNAFSEVLQEYEGAAIVGTDHPTLPTSFVRQSFEALEGARSVCIGPSEDGGFYLLGMNGFYPELFDGMTYSHDAVLSDTLARVERTDARLTVLPQWYDVDTPAMMARMLSDLSSADVRAPRTRQVAKELHLHRLTEAG